MITKTLIAVLWASAFGCGDAGGAGGDAGEGGQDITDGPLSEVFTDIANLGVTESGLRRCGLSEAPWVPYIDGGFSRVFTPPATRYLNDHTIVRGADGVFHLYGITDESPGMPFAEQDLLHATARSLSGPWTSRADILSVRPPKAVLWAPHAFEREPGAYTMYFWGETPDQRPQRADSADLEHWERVASPGRGGRDPFVMRAGSRWLLYSVGVSATAHGQIVLASSADLSQWTAPTVVVEDPVASFGWGNLESPTVATYEGGYYLFLTRTSDAPVDYIRTVVFYSTDPARFAWSPITEFNAHAAEVFSVDGQWYVTSAGWTVSIGERWRGLSLSRVGWAHRCGS